jgi:hypothetical protein
MAGYSPASLAQKLGIKRGSTLLPSHAPRHYLELVAPLPEGVRIVSRLTNRTDIVHLFSTRRSELKRELRSLRARLKQDGVIWVSWPKKSAKVPTDITEDTIRDVALPLGFVDIKVCAVDDLWSGLKLMIRKEFRRAVS